MKFQITLMLLQAHESELFEEQNHGCINGTMKNKNNMPSSHFVYFLDFLILVLQPHRQSKSNTINLFSNLSLLWPVSQRFQKLSYTGVM